MANPLSGVGSWLYHLGNVDAARSKQIGATDAGLVVIDAAHGSMKPYSAAELDIMRGGDDKLIVSYLSIGEAEDYRPYWKNSWSSNPPDFLGAANPEWQDNYKVRYWDPEWQAIVFKAVDRIVDSGFNGVYLDIIDAFQFWEEETNVKGVDFRSEMADFVAAIRKHAEARLAAAGGDRAFVIIGQNGEELVDEPAYRTAIDGIAKEDLRFFYPNGSEGSFKPVPNGWFEGTKEYLEKAEAAGIEVFVVEYLTEGRQSQHSTMLKSEYDYLKSKGIPLYIAEDRDLDAIYDQPFAPLDNDDPGSDDGDGDSPADRTFLGTQSDDRIKGSAGDDIIIGLGGKDVLKGGRGSDLLKGGKGSDVLKGGAGNDVLKGGKGGDLLKGGSGKDVLKGGAGKDVLRGGPGADILDGGRGGDRLDGGGGADVFRFGSLKDSGTGARSRDKIVDFSSHEGDRIDVSRIDADKTESGDQAFAFVGDKEFSGQAGELRVEKSGSSAYVYADVDGDAQADLAIEVKGDTSLSASDFTL